MAEKLLQKKGVTQLEKILIDTDPAQREKALAERRGVIGLAGVDTRALTRVIREKGMPHAVIAHSPTGEFDLDALVAKAKGWAGLVGLDLAKDATTRQTFVWDEQLWEWNEGYGKLETSKYEVVVIDYGVKRNILRSLASIGARATVVPADTKAEEILARKPDGVLLSNGPGDPAATGEYSVPEIRKLVESGDQAFADALAREMIDGPGKGGHPKAAALAKAYEDALETARADRNSVEDLYAAKHIQVAPSP